MTRKILVVNMNYLGDALMTTPAISALRRAFPEAHIDTVAGAGPASEVLDGNPDLDGVIRRTARGSLARCRQLYVLLSQGAYTDVVILPPLPAYAVTAWLARTPVRVGRAGRGMDRFLTVRRPVRGVHMADQMLDTVHAPDSARPAGRQLTMDVSGDSIAAVDRLLESFEIDRSLPMVAINVGATRPQKRWMPEAFAQTLDLMEGVTPLIVGSGEADLKTVEAIAGLVRRSNFISLVGRTGIQELGALLARCAVVISADSGPMHVAAAVGTPTISLFGSTDPRVTGPYDTNSLVLYKAVPCAPCFNHPTCGGRYDCLKAITPEEVVRSVRVLLQVRKGAIVPLSVTQTPTTKRSHETPNILVVTKFRFIGDTLLAIPVFRSIRERWPNARITLLTGRNARVLLENNPYLDTIIEFDPNNRDSGVRHFSSLVDRLRKAGFDYCLVLNRSFHSALLPLLAGVKVRAGFSSEGRRLLLSRAVPYDPAKSEILCYFDILKAIDPDLDPSPDLELWIGEDESEKAGEMLRQAFGANRARMLIGIQPGASMEMKRWSAVGFAEVANELVRSADVDLVLVGSSDEERYAEEMIRNLTPYAREHTVSMVGACDLRGSLALVSRLNLFIGNDTAVRHAAAALLVPTVALFGPTSASKWGSFGARHRTISAPGADMSGIQAEEVVRAASELLMMKV